MNKFTDWYKTGTPWLWICAGSIAFCLIAVLGIILFIAGQAVPHFWPSTIYSVSVENTDGTVSTYLAEKYDTEEVVIEGLKIERLLIKTGNRDLLGSDFKWLNRDTIKEIKPVNNVAIFERREWGNLYGELVSISESGQNVQTENLWDDLLQRIDRSVEIHNRIMSLQKDDIGSINYRLEQLRLDKRYKELNNRFSDEDEAQFKQETEKLNQEYLQYTTEMDKLKQDLSRDVATVKVQTGRAEKLVALPLENVVRGYQSNDLSFMGKISVYFDRIGEFIFDEPREANTEGGVFPAIFGTVMMVILMTIFVTPFGVLAAIYLREYAKQGVITRLIRIAVVNLAGVPSVVYGVFGLGFFVYILGGKIDELFYPEAFPSPTFGTPGILWSSITLALLTLPVVIVTTEEGLARIPRALREGSMALGATKSETLWKVIVPISTPAMITGLILAIARAAGEVAPLMLVGVVKLAPTLPLDGNFPFLHMDRKFMHLGFHIYDVGFQSPNVEAARPLVFATAFLLIIVIVFLNLAAITIRNRLREKYKSLTG